LLLAACLLGRAAAQANFTLLLGLQAAPLPKAQYSPTVMGVNLGALSALSSALSSAATALGPFHTASHLAAAPRAAAAPRTVETRCSYFCCGAA
jgi:hypothetical protein